jgi:hypothetical protein
LKIAMNIESILKHDESQKGAALKSRTVRSGMM